MGEIKIVARQYFRSKTTIIIINDCCIGSHIVAGLGGLSWK